MKAGGVGRWGRQACEHSGGVVAEIERFCIFPSLDRVVPIMIQALRLGSGCSKYDDS